LNIIFLDEYFLFKPSLITRKPSMMEIGVFTVNKADRFAKLYPQGRVALVEPDPGNFETLKRNAAGKTHELYELALTEEDGPAPFYRYGHEQWHSSTPRPDMEAVMVTTVTGMTLTSLLDWVDMKVCDLLLLNCEGGEIFALRQLVASPELRGRVTQICTSFHCSHVKLYPESWRDGLLELMAQWYEIQTGKFLPIPYYLFSAKGV